jgi:hypothetical protein
VYGRGGGGHPADHRVGLSVLENDADVLFGQPKLLRLLPDLIVVPAKEGGCFRQGSAVAISFVRSRISISDQGSPEFASKRASPKNPEKTRREKCFLTRAGLGRIRMVSVVNLLPCNTCDSLHHRQRPCAQASVAESVVLPPVAGSPACPSPRKPALKQSTGIVLDAPPVLIASDHSVDYTCGRCSTVLLHAEPSPWVPIFDLCGI